RAPPRCCERPASSSRRPHSPEINQKRRRETRTDEPSSTMLATAPPHLHAAAHRLSLAAPARAARSARLPLRRPLRYAPLRLRASAAAEAAPSAKEGAEELGFEEMVARTTRRYYMLGGKGGVGKTSCAASLAVRFANSGHPTLVVSTDPAHSLSDSFAQDLTGGALAPVEGTDSPLFALEVSYIGMSTAPKTVYLTP
uniref:ArsA/GET3 Anion-transporting ATPase-like domain-containing protein n=1 Tax=Aegilops tauschii subsp. strangulata TaxID=200361 RepID=A0A453PK71_AEGTS